MGNPKALQQLIETRRLRLNGIKYVVVDEVDACLLRPETSEVFNSVILFCNSMVVLNVATFQTGTTRFTLSAFIPNIHEHGYISRLVIINIDWYSRSSDLFQKMKKTK